MKYQRQWLGAVLLAVCFGAGPALAQTETIDVTLEVLDDVSDIDAVVMRLEDARDRDEDRDRRIDEEREREDFDSSVRDAEGERERRERDDETERNERRELQNEERDLEVDFERERQTPEVSPGETPAQGAR